MAMHTLQPGYLLSEYRIDKLLGEGGFGLTYLAFDTNLEKQVAIKEYMPNEHAIREQDSKIVAKSIASKKIYDWGLNAFINEAKTLAKFKDSNIVTVHRFFKANGTAYIVMEYCEGGCLIDRVSKNSQMSEEKLIDILSPLVRGLQLVHNAGVLHRDIKPENIMFRQDGTPVLIDFGAARQAIGIKNCKVTKIITPGYAPIEQYSSEGNIGPWSDIYSLSAVAYLCLTGHRPPDITNRLENDQIIKLTNNKQASPLLKSIDAGLELHANNRPVNLSDWSANWITHSETVHSSNIASKLTAINFDTSQKTNKTKFIAGIILAILVLIAALTQFDKIKSFLSENQPIKNNNLDLNTTNKQAETIAQQTLAVLPFSNNKPDSDFDYLGFALTNQIIGDLMYLERYNIRPAGSIRKYINKVTDPIEIGKDLKADYVISGNYLKENNIVRLNVELIKISSNQIIWRETMEVEYSNTFALQDLVASKVAKGLNANFLNDNNRDISKNSLAYEYYLRSLSYPSTKEGTLLAVEMLKKSMTIEYDYAPTHVQLGIRLFNTYSLNYDNTTTKYKDVETTLFNALKYNNSSLLALRTLAMLYTQHGEMLKATKMIKKMLKINPNNAHAYFSLAYLYRYTGLMEESIIMADKALSLDKKSYSSLSINYYYIGNYQKALKTLSQRDHVYNTMWEGIVYAKLNQHDKAIEKFNEVIELDAIVIFSYVSQVELAIINKDFQQGLKYLKLLEAENVNLSDGEPLYYLSGYYAILGDKTSSLNLLRKAVNNGFYNIHFMITNSYFNSLRTDAEYIEILNLANEKHDLFKNEINMLKL